MGSKPVRASLLCALIASVETLILTLDLHESGIWR